METDFINLNGELLDAKSPVLYADNRAFRYGDGVFESMRYSSGEVLYYEDHFIRLQNAMKALAILSNEKFSSNNLRFHIYALIQANRISESARIRIEVFRNGVGTYIPDNNGSSFLIQAEPLTDESYLFNKEGLRIDIFQDVKKQVNVFSPYKTASSLLFVMAGLFQQKNNLDDCIILNENENICEANGSNIFIVKDNVAITPPVSDGCIDGVMRKNILLLLATENIPFSESTLRSKDLLDADEIFLTNVSKGIRWVGAVKQKRYYNKLSQSLATLLADLSEIKKV
ncbi:MAG: aminotransferase class IV [Bacteroidia bacterium]|nr:aminotransferase class IV [Bacteroidia bacterium]